MTAPVLLVSTPMARADQRHSRVRDAGPRAGEELLGSEINPFHNLVHLVIGLALARTLAAARSYGWLLAVSYGAAFVYGLIAIGKSWGFLSINAADNWLHALSALVGLVIALGPVRSSVGNRATRA